MLLKFWKFPLLEAKTKNIDNWTQSKYFMISSKLPNQQLKLLNHPSKNSPRDCTQEEMGQSVLKILINYIKDR